VPRVIFILFFILALRAKTATVVKLKRWFCSFFRG